MMVKVVELEPLDTLFFGDGRGLVYGGEGTSADLPSPWTASGSVLTLYGRLKGSFQGLAGEEEKEEKGEVIPFSFYGPLILYKDDLWFRSPVDVMSDGEHLRILKPVDRGPGYAGQLPPMVIPEGFSIYRDLISWSALRSLLLNGSVKRPKIEIKKEERVGIGIDRSSMTVRLGALYRSVHVRPPQGLRICMAVFGKNSSSPDFNVNGINRLGGEGRAALISTKERDIPWLSDRMLESGSVVKVILISPAIYRDGGEDVSKPDVSSVPGKPEIVRALIGRPVKVSGWSLVARRARRMYTAVPPGSVFYLRLRESARLLEVMRSFWELSLFWDRGFGSPIVVEVSE